MKHPPASSPTTDMDTPPPDPTPPGDSRWPELRSLVVGPETKKLEELEKRLYDPDLRAEDVGSVLPTAVTRTSKENDALTNAFIPVVEKAVHQSIKNNTNTFANILYPVIRPAIQKAIASAFKKMIQSLNKTIEYSFSFKGLRWRFESMVTRKPFAEVVLLHSLVFDVDQVFLIHKESGLLLHQVHSPLNASRDGDLVSGMLKAIQDFVQDSFNVKEEGLETIQVGDFNIWIEQGGYAILAGVIRGNAPENLRSHLKATLDSIEHQFREEFEHFQGDPAPFLETGDLLASCLQSEVIPGKRRIPLFSWLLPAALITLGGYLLFTRSQENRLWHSYLDKVEAIPGVIITGQGRQGGKFYVQGLRDPLSDNPEDLIKEYYTDPGAVSSQWGYYYSFEPRCILARARKTLSPPDTVKLELKQGILHVAGSAPRQWVREARFLVRGIPGLGGFDFHELTDLDLADLQALVKKIENQRVEYIVSSDRFIPGQEEHAKAIAADLKTVVQHSLLLDLHVGITINGHADSMGEEDVNRKISTARARAFYRFLVSEGIPQQYLSIQGLGSESLDNRVISLSIQLIPSL